MWLTVGRHRPSRDPRQVVFVNMEGCRLRFAPVIEIPSQDIDFAVFDRILRHPPLLIDHLFCHFSRHGLSFPASRGVLPL